MTREEFGEQVMSVQDTLYRVSFSLLPGRYDQEDAVQETIRVALQKLHTLREERYLRTWMVRILIHECYNILRKKKRETPSDEVFVSLPADGQSEVIEALMALEVKHRLPIVLHYVEGYAIKEIAAMLRLPESTVKTRMARGRTLAREILTEGGLCYERTI